MIPNFIRKHVLRPVGQFSYSYLIKQSKLRKCKIHPHNRDRWCRNKEHGSSYNDPSKSRDV